MSLWQTYTWQQMLKASGQTEDFHVVELTPEMLSVSSPLDGEGNGERFGKESQDTIDIFIEERKIGLGQTGLFIIGLDEAIFYSPETGKMLDEFTQFLEGFLATTKALFLQVENYNVGEYPAEFHGEAYKKFIPRYTALIDLRKSEEEILTDMKPKGRYNIRLAKKKGVTVRELTPTPENIEKFYELMRETTARDSFAGNTLKYYSQFLQMNTDAKLYVAEHDGDILAMGIFVHSGDEMIYYYGASSNSKRNLMAPYALQWFAITEAKRLGAEMYDFLGVAGDNEPDSPLSGVTDFKMKLAPQKYHISESELIVARPIRYRVFSILKRISQYVR